MKKLISISLLANFLFLNLSAQQHDSKAVKDANNPLATIKSVSFHNIYSPSLNDAEGTMNTMWVRYAQPFGRLLVRASMPVNSVNIGDSNQSGFGDFTMFGAFILSKPESHRQFGIGPLLAVPTASYTALGSGKWQLGAAMVGYFDANPVLQVGFLGTWQHSFAGSSNRAKVNMASFQPFFMWQLGKGLYMRSTAISVFDISNDKCLIPIGLGIGKVIKAGNAICNLFAEPQFTVYNRGSGLPKTQIFIGINTQF